MIQVYQHNPEQNFGHNPTKTLSLDYAEDIHYHHCIYMIQKFYNQYLKR